jgi:rfaE bifunctional protein kinase chain/domain
VTTAEILAAIPRLSALVVGDICLDRWCRYEPSVAEPSRETGIPRTAVVATEVSPGAGGTVASNLAALGAGRVAVLGVVGHDGHGSELEQALRARGIEPDLLVWGGGVQTFTYTKLLNERTGVEDLPRVDFINTRPLTEKVERQVLDRLWEAAPAFDAILVADQAETHWGGVVTDAVRQQIADLARRFPAKTLLADSRTRVEHFRGVAVKPNQEEAEAACRRLVGRADHRALLERVGGPFLYVTHGPRGVLVVEAAGETWVPARPLEKPVDICGAGDSFSAGAALALAVTGSPAAGARLGNLVASVTIMKPGTGTASPDEVRAADLLAPP